MLPCLLQELSLALAWLFGLSFWSRCQPNSHPKSSKNLMKINVFSFLLPFASFCFHACSKSYPRCWRGFSGSLFGAVVDPARPTTFAPCCVLFLPCWFQEQCSGQSLLVGLSFWNLLGALVFQFRFCFLVAFALAFKRVASIMKLATA